MTPWRAGIKADVERANRKKMNIENPLVHAELPEVKVFGRCETCKQPIYYGDEYYEVFGARVCAGCIDKSLKEAEEEPHDTRDNGW